MVHLDAANAAKMTGDAKGDMFTSIENLVGSAFNDKLFGDSADNQLYGRGGNDLLDGGAGNDFLFDNGATTPCSAAKATTC